MAAAIAAVAGRIGRRRRTVVTAVAIVAYIAFAGASPSVLRAGTMAGVVLLARESGRAGRAAAALGWAAASLLLVDPALIADAGFQLSTLATAGLIAWATPLTDRLDRLTGGRLPRWLAESLGVSLAAQAATLLIVLASFGRLALIAPVVNLLIVPIVAPAMAAGLLALLGGALVSMGIPAGVGLVLATPGWVALRVIIGIIEVAAAVPLASVAFEPATGVALGGASVVLGVGRSHGDVVACVVPVGSRGPGAGRATTEDRTSPAIGADARGHRRSRGGGRGRRRGRRRPVGRRGSRDRARCRTGRRDPDRGVRGRSTPRGWWPRPRSTARRLGPPDPAMGSPHRHPGAEASEEDHVAGLALLLDRYRVGQVL